MIALLFPNSIMTKASASKDSRIDLRVTKEQKALIEKAASIKGVSLSAYTLLHLLPLAQQEIDNQEKLTLSNRDRDLFLTALDNPPQLTGKLKKAISEYQAKYE